MNAEIIWEGNANGTGKQYRLVDMFPDSTKGENYHYRFKLEESAGVDALGARAWVPAEADFSTNLLDLLISALGQMVLMVKVLAEGHTTLNGIPVADLACGLKHE